MMMLDTMALTPASCEGRQLRIEFGVPITRLFAWGGGNMFPVCVGGGGIWEDMCYERLRAEAFVD
jgi:hypothetical protein